MKLKKAKKPKPPAPITDEGTAAIVERLRQNLRVRRRVLDGRLHIDRQLPFLCVYRRRPGGSDAGADRLIHGEASYLTATVDRRTGKKLRSLVEEVVRAVAPEFGAFLILEIWEAPDEPPSREAEHKRKDRPQRPRFKILYRKGDGLDAVIDTLRRALRRIRVNKLSAEVETARVSKPRPKGFSRWLEPAERRSLGCHVIGIEVRPVYRSSSSGTVYTAAHRVMRRGFGRALKRAFFEFTRRNTTHTPKHFHALGRRAMVKVVWEVDRRLARVSSAFDFLLLTTPVNMNAAWRRFRRKHYDAAPRFLYRPVSFSPSDLKREMYSTPVERIEDPTLAHLFSRKRRDLDRQLSMIEDKGTSDFLYGSLQVYGTVDDALAEIAEELLDRIPPRKRQKGARGSIGSDEFAERAREEIENYRRAYPDMKASVRIRNDISGLQVSGGNLLVGRSLSIPRARVDAMIQHEVGTHVLTYHNGRAQPFRQLYCGLPGYGDLQEGLAVLAEYLSGGLSPARLRLLAARVIAVRQLIGGADFMDIFREMRGGYGFTAKTSFRVAARVCRSAGLTKDAMYLRGLIQLLEYLKGGGDFELLFVGKISADHAGVIKELLWREVLRPAPLRPAYLDRPDAQDRLTKARRGLDVFQMANEEMLR